ncbi:MAG: nuclear transport factor 2 family protein [Desulfobacterales bacterium]
MKLTREDIEELWNNWNSAWNSHDLDAVMAFFHDHVFFENWTGGYAKGKENLRKSWRDWFEHHGDFMFFQEDMFFDEKNQKLLYQWLLTWPSRERGCEGKPEKRRGVDVIHFKDGEIIMKLTYSKTTIDIEGKRVYLNP